MIKLVDFKSNLGSGIVEVDNLEIKDVVEVLYDRETLIIRREEETYDMRINKKQSDYLVNLTVIDEGYVKIVFLDADVAISINSNSIVINDDDIVLSKY